MINNVLYLGPTGSYTDLAKNKFSSYFNMNTNFKPEKSINKIIRTLIDDSSNEISAVIPIENSIEGIVRETLDNLYSLSRKNIRILAETRLPIVHSLIGYGAKNEIKSVISHPQALAQCREYLFDNFNYLNEIPTLSTSSAISSLSSNDTSIAAIGSEYCAKLYKKPIIENNINDEENNITRFILLSNTRPQKKETNKISITFSTENKAGALKKILEILEKYNLNMSYIDSRPSRKQLGEYVFFIDFAGHLDEPKVSLALQGIQCNVRMLEILSEGAEIVI